MDTTRQKERLGIPGAERLQHFVGREKFAVDLRESERAVDSSISSKEARIEPIKCFTESCPQLGNARGRKREAAREFVSPEMREDVGD